MKLSVTRSIGMTGLVETISVDSETLARVDADALRANVEKVDLFALRIGPIEARHADAVDYELTVEDAGRSNRVLISEAQLSAVIRSLIKWLESVPGSEKRLEPAGGDRPFP